ncbi:hypothetical protein QWY79_15190 [Halomonas sabkhae]|uniref:hypothetical protein n=1 Tax=Halomonas sabkhae TaxID=626223 RepID=UPI0025B58505|nr:hypothetical protein [Halomonas sabkhae]MDN3526615.1 hypothetical protein [Halomonas sabkhae]
MKETYTALYEFGGAFLGPSLTTYARAVEKASQGQNTLPVCLAREGWLLYRLLDRLQAARLIDLPTPPVYLKVSRTLLFRAMLGDPDVMDMALSTEFTGTVVDLLMKRFGFQLNETYKCLPAEILSFEMVLPDHKERVLKWFEPHYARLRSHVAQTRQALLDYFTNTGLATEGVTPLMLDLGYGGTIQKLCTRLLEKDTRGLYYIAKKAGEHDVEGHQASMSGVFREGINWQENYTMLERSLLLECLMTAPHGQVVDLKENADGEMMFFYGREAASQRYYQDLEAILDGAIDTAIYNLRHGIHYTHQEVEALFEVYAKRPGALPKAVWHLFTADDDISGNGIVNPLQIFGI